MRILLLHNRYRQRGGEDVCVEALNQLLRSNGHEVRLIEADNKEIEGPAAVMEAAVGWVYSHKWRTRVAREIASFKPHVAHVHNVFPLLSPSVIYACNAAGVPVVHTLHNYRLLCSAGTLFRSGNVCEACVKTIFPWPGIVHHCYHRSSLGTAVVGTGLVIHRLLGTYAQRVDCFIALTEFAKNKFVSADLPEHKFAVVPNWLVSDPGPGDGRGGYFLYVGRLSPEKGVATLLESWPKVKFPARLKIVGTGPLEGDVVAAAGCGGGVEHVGYQPPNEVLKLMQQASALILPSQCYEGLPLTIVEAYATGTPVIASRLGSLQELVADQRTGLLFPPCDADALAQKIEWIIANPERLLSMRAAARAEYEARYTADHSYRMLMSVYNNVVGTAAMDIYGSNAGRASGSVAIPSKLRTEKGVKYFEVLGVRFAAVQISDVIHKIEGWIAEGRQAHYVTVSNVHSVVESQRDARFRETLNGSDLNVPDGMPIVWLGRSQGHNLPRRVYGPDLFIEFCRDTQGKNYRHFFYGGAPDVVEALVHKLKEKFPDFQVVGYYSPPFRPLTPREDLPVIEMINTAEPDVLWIGLGCPKQEFWMREHLESIRVPAIIGIGQAFNIHSGKLRQAPQWMRNSGLEWLFRLLLEPRRLWRRYLVYNTRFIVRLLVETLRARIAN